MASKKTPASKPEQPPKLKVQGQVAIERVRELLQREDKADFQLVATRPHRADVFPDAVKLGRLK
jgi:hypothetical protein